MGGGGFEPPKQVAADLQSVPFGHSGIRPYSIYSLYRENAQSRNRTSDTRIFSPLLYQLSYLGIIDTFF